MTVTLRLGSAYETVLWTSSTRNKPVGPSRLNRTTVSRSSGARSPIELGWDGALCPNRTDFSDEQDRRIAIYAYRALDSGANGANRTLIGCLPCNCSPIELHWLEPEGVIETPTLRGTGAVLFRLSYSGMERVRRIELR